MKSESNKLATKTVKAGKATKATKAAAPVSRPTVKAKAKAPVPILKKAPIAIPSILLEGDASPAPAVSGPGERYAQGRVNLSAGQPPLASAELPDAYGTQRLLLTARDPHWLYAHWDLSQEQLRRYNARSVDQHLVLRIHLDEVAGEPHREIHVHPESRNWFANVGHAGARYVAQLGYYRPAGAWVAISTSGVTLTPPDTMSDDISVWFATLPVELQFENLLRLVKTAVLANVPLLEAIAQLRATGMPKLPDARAASTGRWTAEQERAMAQVIQMDDARRVWMGSLEITELIRRQFLHELSSQAAAQFSLPTSLSGAFGSLSSAFGGGGSERKKGFWFNVNAELIIYGATEPDASVTIGGRTIKLRPDGTFSYRFALPDGQYDLPAVATSADGSDSRAAELAFSRRTDYHGDVGQHPQDARLNPPLVAHVS